MMASDLMQVLEPFTYFEDFSKKSFLNLSQIVKFITFVPQEIILGGNNDRKSYVYFLIEGKCDVIESLHVRVHRKNNKTIYKLLEKKENDSQEHFLNVYSLHKLSCFNIGENLQNRQIVAVTHTKCILIPYYWLLENDQLNTWNRIKQFLNFNLPTTQKAFESFVEEKKLRENIEQENCKENEKKHNQNDQIPYLLRILEL